MKKRVGLVLACLSWRGCLASCPRLMGGGLLLVVLRSWGKSQGFPRLISQLVRVGGGDNDNNNLNFTAKSFSFEATFQ